MHVSDQRLKNRLYEGGVRSWGLFVRSILINQHLPDKTRKAGMPMAQMTLAYLPRMANVMMPANSSLNTKV